MTISIVMATYNGEKYLTEQLDSLRLQTRPADEVIIQDDGSTDGTVKLVSDYIKKYDLSATWNFTCNDHNLGYAENFKTATLKSKGDLIFFCDQDDIWHTDKLELVEKCMEQNKDIQVLCSHFKPFVTGQTTSELRDISKEVNDGGIEKIAFNQKNMFIDSLGCAMVLRREFINATEEYWFTGVAHDEYAWKFALCVDGLYWYNNCLFDRRHHADNVSMHKMRNFEKRVQYLDRLLVSYTTMLKCLEDNNADDTKIKIVKKQIRAVELRQGLMKDKKYLNAVKLFFKYRKTYQTIKTIPMELYMSMFSKKFQ